MRRIIEAVIVAALLVGVAYAADEIKMDDQLTANKGNFSLERKPGRISIDMVGLGASDITMNIATGAHTLLTVTLPTGTNGVSWIRNLSTNEAWYLEIGPEVGAAFIPVMRLNANELWTGRIHPTNAIYGRATGGTIGTRVIVLDN